MTSQIKDINLDDDFDLTQFNGDVSTFRMLLEKYKIEFSNEFNEVYNGLDEYQKQILGLDINKPIRASANPGSGKTRVLIARAMDLVINKGVLPHQIALITFTNKAAKEIKERYNSLFSKVLLESESKYLKNPYISTIHSFGRHLMINHLGVRVSLNDEYKSIKLLKTLIQEVTKVDKVKMEEARKLYLIFESIYGNNELHFFKYPIFNQSMTLLNVLTYEEAIQSNLEEIKKLNHFSYSVIQEKLHERKNIDPNDLNWIQGIRESYVTRADYGYKTFVDILELYINTKYKSYNTDFSDCMLIPLYLMIQHPDLRLKFVNEYRYVMEDESQDQDSLQAAFIFTISGYFDNCCNLMLVGDTKQTLYTFRNANPDILEKMDDILGFEAQKGTIISNYRSSKQLVELANLFSYNFEDMDIFPSEPIRSDGVNPLQIKSFPTQYGEYTWIAREIKSLFQKGKSYGDMAIISRTNRALIDIEASLITEKIPYLIKYDSRSLTRASSFKFLYYIYSILLNQNDIVSFLELLNSLKGIGPKFLNQIQSSLIRHQKTQILTIPDIASIFRHEHTKQYNILIDFIDLFLIPLKQMFDKKPSYLDLNNYIFNMLEENFLFEGDNYTRKHFDIQIEKINFTKTFRTFNNIYMTSLEEAEFERKTNFSKFLQIYELLQLSQNPEGNDVEDKTKIQLSTIHSFKGMEKDVIFFASLNSLGPFKHAELFSETCGFYVAITRAKEHLYITYSEKVTNYDQRLMDTKPNPLLQKYIGAIEQFKKSRSNLSK